MYDNFRLFFLALQGRALRIPKKERQVLDIMVHLYGTTKPNVWINYIRFERDLGNPMNVTVMYQRAQNTLKPEFRDDFVKSYNSITTDIA